MEIYDLYYDAFNLGDIRNSLKEGEVIEDPSSGDKYKVVDIDNIGEYVVIERMSSFTRMYLDQEYMVQYCEWDERWYAWGTEFNISVNDDNLEDVVNRFEAWISFFLYEG